MTDHEPFDLPGAVDDVSALPENIRPAYQQSEDGKWRPRIRAADDGWAFENVGGLKSALESEREKARRLSGEFKQLQAIREQLGEYDPSDLIETYERVKSGKMTGSDEIDKAKTSIKRQMEEQMAAMREELEGQVKARDAELQRRLVEAEAVKACSAAGADAELLLPHIERHCEVRPVTRDGKEVFEAVVLNDRGEPRVSSREGADYMTVEEFVVDVMKHDRRYARAFGQPQGGNLRERFGGTGGEPPLRGKPGTSRWIEQRGRQLRQRG